MHIWLRTRTPLVLVAIMAGMMAVWSWSAAAVAGDQPEMAEVELSLPPKGMESPQSGDEIRNKQQAARDSADAKYRQARLLFKVKRWQDCIDACDHVLTIDPGHGKARELKREAIANQQNQFTENLDTERVVRDSEALRSVTEEGLIPHRGPDLPRPVVTEKDVPFPASEHKTPANQALLGSRLPELNLIDADLNYVLQLLFKVTGVNIIYNPEDIQNKTVTIHARNLTLQDILDYLSRSYNIGYTVNKGTVWVYAADQQEAQKALLRPAIFPLKYGLTGGQVQEPAANNAADTGNMQDLAAAFTGGGGGGSGESGGSDIEAMLTWMEENWPGWPEESRWWLDRKLNRLVIISTPYIIEEVGKMVEMLDVPPVQVLVIARFIDVREDDLDQLGFDWKIEPHPRILPRAADQAGSWRDNKARLQTTDVNLSVTGDALTSGAVAILNEHQLSFALQALERITSTKLMTAPRVIAYNNRTRTISLTDTLPYQSDVRTETVTTSTDTNTTSSTTLIPEWDTVDLGFILTVTPSVGADMKTISLVLTPEITDVTGTVTETIVVANPDAAGDKAQSFELERPIVNKQTLTVEATVEDGQTLVVGGLSRDNHTRTRKAVPVLSKIPLLGPVFKSKDDRRDRSCLLIFVTARIITPQNRIYTDEIARADRELREEAAANGFATNADVLNEWLGDPKAAPNQQ